MNYLVLICRDVGKNLDLWITNKRTFNFIYSDVRCGKLLCQGGKTRTVSKFFTIIHNKIKCMFIKSPDTKGVLDAHDMLGYVSDFTKCGSNKVSLCFFLLLDVMYFNFKINHSRDVRQPVLTSRNINIIYSERFRLHQPPSVNTNICSIHSLD